MNRDIELLVRKKPHLRDPFALYEKVLQFCAEAEALVPSNGASPSVAGSTAYPRSSAGPVIDRFSSIFAFPDGTLDPLKLALEAGDIDLTRLPLNEVPAFSLPYPEEELATLLFLLGKPFFTGLRAACSLDNRFWDEGRCPVCTARPALSSVTEEPRRHMHCSFCGTRGHFTYVGCPVCLSVDLAKLGTIEVEEEPGYRIDTCDECGAYVKTVEAKVLQAASPDIADLASLPLDIIAQGRGYIRHAPNPIGLRKMA